jgi:hypothetical protein
MKKNFKVSLAVAAILVASTTTSAFANLAEAHSLKAAGSSTTSAPSSAMSHSNLPNIGTLQANISAAEKVVQTYKCNDVKAAALFEKTVDAYLKPYGYSLEKAATIPNAKMVDFATRFQAAGPKAVAVVVTAAKNGCKGIK